MEKDKIQKAYDKMLEGTDIKAVIKNLDNKHANEMKKRYYAIADNISGLAETLALIPELKEEYRNAKAALKAFNKMDLGKYI